MRIKKFVEFFILHIHRDHMRITGTVSFDRRIQRNGIRTGVAFIAIVGKMDRDAGLVAAYNNIRNTDGRTLPKSAAKIGLHGIGTKCGDDLRIVGVDG